MGKFQIGLAVTAIGIIAAVVLSGRTILQHVSHGVDDAFDGGWTHDNLLSAIIPTGETETGMGTLLAALEDVFTEFEDIAKDW